MLFWGIFQERKTSRGLEQTQTRVKVFFCVFFILCAIEITTWLPTLLIKNKFRPMNHFHIFFFLIATFYIKPRVI